MFEKKKAQYIVDKIQKYAGGAVRATLARNGDKWIVSVDIFEDSFKLNFKDIEIHFARKKHGNP
jgi:hypothetical protein